MKRRRSIVVLLVMFLCVGGAALAHLSLRLGVIRLGYAISEETRAQRELQEENRRLRVELSLLRNPERIERLAREKLGMRKPAPWQIRVVRPGVAELASARAARTRPE